MKITLPPGSAFTPAGEEWNGKKLPRIVIYTEPFRLGLRTYQFGVLYRRSGRYRSVGVK